MMHIEPPPIRAVSGSPLRVASRASDRCSRALAFTRQVTPTVSVTVVIALTLITALPADADGADPDLPSRVAALRQRVVELAGDEDLLDTLYFAWADRPYARATLAILVHVSTILGQEVEVRAKGDSIIDDAAVEPIFRWADDAIHRVIHSQPTPDFKPHRLTITKDALSSLPTLPPLFAFVDEVRAPRRHPIARDLDLFAAFGQRVYAIPPTTYPPAEDVALLAARAASLGVALLSSQPNPVQKDGTTSCLRRFSWGALGTQIDVVSLWSLTSADAPSAREFTAIPAVTDPPGGESLEASMARRALVRGVLARRHHAAERWRPPLSGAGKNQHGAAIAATMWMHALDGQCLALVSGWTDSHPSDAETIAHTALDLLRLQDHVKAFQQAARVAVMVSADAIEPGDAYDEKWSSWIEPTWSALLDRQVYFDVVSDKADEGELRRRYLAVLRLDNQKASNPAQAYARFERQLAQEEEHVYRLTARDLEGMIAKDAFVRVGRTAEGRDCAAVVNLSNDSRALKLRGRPAVGPSMDVVADEPIPEPTQRIDFAPWQVRLLIPAGGDTK